MRPLLPSTRLRQPVRPGSRGYGLDKFVIQENRFIMWNGSQLLELEFGYVVVEQSATTREAWKRRKFGADFGDDVVEKS